MKKLLPVAILLFAVLGCDLSKYMGGGNQANSNTAKPAPTAESKPSPTVTPKPEVTPDKAAFLQNLKKSAGKYPNDIKLLDIAVLQSRLKKLLGKDFADMKSHWNVETPIEVDSGIFMASACEAHNCGSNRYLLFVDLNDDNINVFHIEDEGTRHYFEGGEIKLPGKFAGELDK